MSVVSDKINRHGLSAGSSWLHFRVQAVKLFLVVVRVLATAGRRRHVWACVHPGAGALRRPTTVSVSVLLFHSRTHAHCLSPCRCSPRNPYLRIARAIIHSVAELDVGRLEFAIMIPRDTFLVYLVVLVVVFVLRLIFFLIFITDLKELKRGRVEIAALD